MYGDVFTPKGVIGGPPCQSFSQANVNQQDDDPRHSIPVVYADLIAKLNARAPIDFFVMENVVGITQSKHRKTLIRIIRRFERAGFEVASNILDAKYYGTPQARERFFLVGFNKQKFGSLKWTSPLPQSGPLLTVRQTIEGLPPATLFERGLDSNLFPHHPNHWCMKPKSPKFLRPGALKAGDVKSRSFKTLAWDRPSIAVAYGHREVHIHPSGTRRLTVYEAMRLQGFPHEYRLRGTLSSQITQVSEAVPPPLALAVAKSVQAQIYSGTEGRSADEVVNLHGAQRKSGEPSLPRAKVIVS